MDVTEEFKLWMSVYTSQHTEPVVILSMVTDVNGSIFRTVFGQKNFVFLVKEMLEKMLILCQC